MGPWALSLLAPLKAFFQLVRGGHHGCLRGSAQPSLREMARLFQPSQPRGRGYLWAHGVQQGARRFRISQWGRAFKDGHVHALGLGSSC
jgi:hypothetical protein